MTRKITLIVLVACSFALTAAVAQADTLTYTNVVVSNSTTLFDLTTLGATDWVLPAKADRKNGGTAISTYDTSLRFYSPAVSTVYAPSNGGLYFTYTNGTNAASYSGQSGFEQLITTVAAYSMTNITLPQGNGTVDVWWYGGTYSYRPPFFLSATLSGGTSVSITADQGTWDHTTLSYNISSAQTLNLTETRGDNQWGMGVMGVAVTSTPAPEPSALALLASGLFGLLCYAWKKRR